MSDVCLSYSPQTNRWSKVASMSTRRLGVGVAVLGGCLYAVGGSDGASPLNTGLISLQLSKTFDKPIGICEF